MQGRAIDVRFVAATNRDLETEIEHGTFRRDLYFRLNGVTIVIPPLRERLGRDRAARERVLAPGAARAGHRGSHLTAEALEVMRGYSWPGNVRELKNMIERAVLLCERRPDPPRAPPRREDALDPADRFAAAGRVERRSRARLPP